KVDPADAMLTHGGRYATRYVRRREVEALAAELLRQPDLCPGCGRPLKPGRLACDIACAAPLAWTEAARAARLENLEKLSATIAAWWASPEGERRRDELRDASVRVPTTCWVCHASELRW